MKLDLKKIKKELLHKQRKQRVREQNAKIQQADNTRERDSFREAMSGVTPLSHDKAYHEVPPSKTVRKKPEEDSLIIHDPLSDELEVEEINAADILSFCRSGIQKGVFRKLRSGHYRISDELDLHGTTLKQAKKILVYYLQEAIQFEGCCVRIIHGKGHRSSNNKPVLKTHVNHWLSEHDRVLAFHSTKPKDGGTGAVYVLLKTRNIN